LLSEARAHEAGDPSKALEAAEQAEGLFRDAGDKGGEMDALCAIVSAMIASGDADQALKLAEERLTSAQTGGDASKEVGAMLALAEAHLAVGDPDAALKLAKQACRAAEHIGDVVAEAKAATAQARAYTNLGNPAEGAKAAMEALGLCTKSGQRQAEAQAQLALSSAREVQGDDVVGPLNKALSIYRELGYRSDEATVLCKISEAQLNTRPQEALLMGKESMAIFRELDLTNGEAEALHSIVKAYGVKDEAADALRVVKDRMATAGKKAQVLFTPAAITAHLNNEDVDAALAAATDGLETAIDTEDRKGEAWMLYKVAEVRLAKEEVEEALAKTNEALDIFFEVGDKVGEAAAQALLTAAYTMNNQAHKAPHRVVGLEQLGKLVEAIIGRNKNQFFEAFEKLNTTLGVDQKDFDAVLKPLFRKDKEAEEFYKESSYEFYGLVYEKERTTDHLRTAKNVDRLAMFIGQRFGSMGYGPSFRSVQATWRKGDTYTIGSGTHALSIIQDETKENWEEVAVFQAHPGMMDAALQVQGIPHSV